MGQIPDLVQPVHVVDLGAGDKKLERTLASKYDIRYSGYDKHPQADDVQAWEANVGLPADLGDVCFALGLIEYLESPGRLFEHATASSRYFIFSYVTSDAGMYSATRIKRLGWKTHHSAAEIETMVRAAGLDILARVDNAVDHYSIWLTSSTHQTGLKSA